MMEEIILQPMSGKKRAPKPLYNCICQNPRCGITFQSVYKDAQGCNKSHSSYVSQLKRRMRDRAEREKALEEIGEPVVTVKDFTKQEQSTAFKLRVSEIDAKIAKTEELMNKSSTLGLANSLVLLKRRRREMFRKNNASQA